LQRVALCTVQHVIIIQDPDPMWNWCQRKRVLSEQSKEFCDVAEMDHRAV
jgi:hypothetical protein